MSSERRVEAGWLERLNISSILIALPVAHLLVASLYTWGWLSGFGANVAVLADPRDLFSVSISALIPVYLIGLILPVAQLAFMKRRFKGGSGRTTASERSKRWTEGAVVLGLWLMLLQAVLGSFDLLHRGQTQGLTVLIALNVAGIIAYKFILDHVEFTGESFRMVNVAVGLLCSAIGFGWAHGNFARYNSYEPFTERLAHCGEFLVQRRFGENYVAITRNDSKAVIDLECKVVMTVPDVQGEARREFHLRPYPHLHYVLEGQDSPKH